MTGKTWRSRAALLTALACVLGLGGAQASTVQERVAGLYANPDAIESLYNGVIPPRWEDSVAKSQTFADGEYRFLRCMEDALSWTLQFEADEPAPSGRLVTADLETTFPMEAGVRFRFTLYEGLLEQDARFVCIGDSFNWSVAIPREACLAALTEYVTLADFSERPAEQRTDAEPAERMGEVKDLLLQWREKYALVSERFWSADHTISVDADYELGVYTLDTWFDYEWLSYTLTDAQYKAVAGARAERTPEEWRAYAEAFAASLGRVPDRILSLSGGEEGEKSPFLSAIYERDQFDLCVFDEEKGFFEEWKLQQAEYEALAAECLALPPAERGAYLHEAYERLRAEND